MKRMILMCYAIMVALNASAESVATNGYTWTYSVSAGKATITAVTPQPTGVVNIPPVLSGYAVESIGNNAFQGCHGIVSITIPKDVTHIGNHAFNCGGLKSIELPSKLKTVGDSAFDRCYNLEYIVIPPEVTSIGQYAFDCCASISKLDFPNTLSTMGYRALCKCGGLRTLTIPFVGRTRGMTGTSDSIFAHLFGTALGEVSGTYKIFSSYAAGASVRRAVPIYLETVFITDETIIPYGAFSGWDRLKSVSINNGVREIGGCAFDGCCSLTNMIIPRTVSSIGPSAFRNCGSLTCLTISSGIEVIAVGANTLDASTEAIIEGKQGYVFVGWTNAMGHVVIDPFHSPDSVTVSPAWQMIGRPRTEATVIETRNAAERKEEATRQFLDACRKKEYDKAAKFVKLIDSENVNVQYNLGKMYDDGKGVLRDDVESVRWYRKAANQGYAKAQFLLGTMYENGEGVTKDKARAGKWYRMSIRGLLVAAKQGDAEAQYFLGCAYDDGTGVTQNETEANRWFHMAAENGEVHAQVFLGFMYYDGILGVKKDATKATKWLRKAADQGDAEAEAYLRKIEADRRCADKSDDMVVGTKVEEEYFDSVSAVRDRFVQWKVNKADWSKCINSHGRKEESYWCETTLWTDGTWSQSWGGHSRKNCGTIIVVPVSDFSIEKTFIYKDGVGIKKKGKVVSVAISIICTNPNISREVADRAVRNYVENGMNIPMINSNASAREKSDKSIVVRRDGKTINGAVRAGRLISLKSAAKKRFGADTCTYMDGDSADGRVRILVLGCKSEREKIDVTPLSM